MLTARLGGLGGARLTVRLPAWNLERAKATSFLAIPG
jgi:hypothetical protein